MIVLNSHLIALQFAFPQGDKRGHRRGAVRTARGLGCCPARRDHRRRRGGRDPRAPGSRRGDPGREDHGGGGAGGFHPTGGRGPQPHPRMLPGTGGLVWTERKTAQAVPGVVRRCPVHPGTR